jgi:hypothetical protein
MHAVRGQWKFPIERGFLPRNAYDGVQSAAQLGKLEI